MWKAAGKPRSGPIFSTYRKDKAAYKNGIRNRQRDEKSVYTNELHEAKNVTEAWFWLEEVSSDLQVLNTKPQLSLRIILIDCVMGLTV